MPLPARVSDLTGFDLLLSVARTGSIGRAAAEHGVSQPAASARMRLLEGQLGLALIERSPRGSKLTPAGALVAGWAQAAVGGPAALDAGGGGLGPACRGRRGVAGRRRGRAAPGARLPAPHRGEHDRGRVPARGLADRAARVRTLRRASGAR